MNLHQAEVNATRAQLEDALQALPRGTVGIQALVTAVDPAGATRDGNPRVTVTWHGQAISVPYLSSYTPTVGHQGLVLLADTDPVLLGRIIGTPAS